MANVDDFWRQLNAKKTSKASLSGLSDIPGLTTYSRTLPSKSSSVSAPSATLAAPHTPVPATQVAAALPDQQGLQASIQRDINCLKDQDRSLRHNSIGQLLCKLFADTQAQDMQLLQQVICSSVLVPMARLLADPVEKCREGAMTFFTTAAEHLPDPAALLSCLMPAMTDRMGEVPVVEPSEELRLAITRLIAGPVIQRSGSGLLPYLTLVVKVVCRGLEDPFHDIKKAACNAITNLCKQMPADAVCSQHNAMLPSLLPNLSHQHSRVRASSLAALDTLVNKGVSEKSLVDMVAPAVKPLVSDRSHAVKEQCFTTVAGWLGASRQTESQTMQPGMSAGLHRAYMVHLLPVLLLGLTDEAQAIRDTTTACLNQVGERHQAIQSTSAAYQGLMSVLNLDGLNDLTAVDIKSSEVDKDRLTSNESASSSSAASSSWPPGFTHPFQNAPPAATQAMLQNILQAILPPIVADLREWTISLRLNASRCLHSVLLLSGAAVSSHLPHLLSPLCSAAGDEDAQVAQYVVQCAQVIGAYTQMGHWLPLMVDTVAAPQASLTTRVNALVVLSAMLYAAGVMQQGIQCEQLALLVNALCSDAVRGVDQEPAQQQLLAVVFNTITLAGSECSSVSQQLWLLLLQLQADDSSSALASQAAAASDRLAAACALSSTADLAAMHAPALISDVTQHAEDWTSHTPDCHVFSVLLLKCPGHTLQTLLPQALCAVSTALQDPDRDPALRIRLLQLLEQVLANEDQAKAFAGPLAEQLASQALLPALLWRAGKAAAAVRFAAMTAVSTLFAQRLLHIKQLQAMLTGDSLLPMMFQSLEEEYFVDTRLAACSGMYHLLLSAGDTLTYEQCRIIYPELLKRLDDSSNTVRVNICQALNTFVQSMGPSLDDSNVTYFINGMLIHMDDVDPAVQEAVCSVLESAAIHKPLVVKDAVSKAQHLHRSSIFTSRVLLACRR